MIRRPGRISNHGVALTESDVERDEGRVTREIVLAAPRDEVWEAITRPERLAEWFGGEIDIDPVPRGRVEHRAPDGSRRAGRVVSVDAPMRLVLWWADAEDAPGGTAAGGTRVEFVLLAHGDGTLLTVTESEAPSPLAMAG
jgi:uncharacterized protein YndB with AHSA1/START domain